MAFASGDLERELCRIPDVFAARVTVDGSGRATEARILATPERPAKRVRKDVQSVAMASFGIDLPASAISITQLDQAAAHEEEAASQEHAAPAGEPYAPAAEQGPPAGETAATEPDATTAQAAYRPMAGADPEVDNDLDDLVDDDLDEDEDEDLGEPDEAGAASPKWVGAEAPRSAVAQPGPTSSGAAPQEAQGDATGRTELARVTTSAGGDRVTVAVELTNAGRSATGQAAAAASEALSARAVAQAVLDATTRLGLVAPGAGVEQAAVVHLGATRVAVVVVALPGSGPSASLVSGSFVVTGAGDHHCLARAALAALLPSN